MGRRNGCALVFADSMYPDTCPFCDDRNRAETLRKEGKPLPRFGRRPTARSRQEAGKRCPRCGDALPLDEYCAKCHSSMYSGACVL